MTDLSFSSNFENLDREMALALEAVKLPATLTTLPVAYVYKSETPVVEPMAAVVGRSSLPPF